MRYLAKTRLYVIFLNIILSKSVGYAMHD